MTTTQWLGALLVAYAALVAVVAPGLGLLIGELGVGPVEGAAVGPTSGLPWLGRRRASVRMGGPK